MRSQHGLTLVELLIAMSVTAAILVGIGGVVQVGVEVAEHWTAPVQDATVANQLADWLQQDSHRYVVCVVNATELHFCQPDDGTPRVSYVQESSTQATSCLPSPDNPCDLVRRDCSMTTPPCSSAAGSTTGTRAVLVRRLTREPDFAVRGCESANVMTGTIWAYTVAPQPIKVAFRAPKGVCP